MAKSNGVAARILAGMSRREFLKIGGAGLAGAALLGIPGCGGSDSAGGKVQLTLWHQEQPPNRVKQFQKVIDAFNKSPYTRQLVALE